MDQLKSDGAKRNRMVWILFHPLPSYFFPSDLDRMNNLSFSILKYQNNEMKSSFYFILFRILLYSISLIFMISKYNLRYFLDPLTSFNFSIERSDYNLIFLFIHKILVQVNPLRQLQSKK